LLTAWESGGNTARLERGLYVSRLTFAEFFPDWLRARKPYLARTWSDYEIHGRKRLVPYFGERRLTAITTFEVRDWLLELHEAGDYAPKTLNNALGVMVAALNGAVADRLLPLNPAAGVERLPARPRRARLAASSRNRPLPRRLLIGLPAPRRAPHRIRDAD
jgi:hypothetical protein